MAGVAPLKLNEVLKQNRERRRASLQSIHQDTKISIVFLQALEAGEYEKFPAEVYCVGFLRKYAAYLGLNPEEMVELYRKEQESKKSVKIEEAKKQIEEEKDSKSADLIKVLSLVLLLLFVGGWWLLSVVRTSAPQRVSKHSEIPPETIAAPVLPTKTETLNLTAYAVEGVWLRVGLDKKLSFEGFLTVGSTRSWEAQDEIALRIGNVEAVRLTLNGRPVDTRAGAVQAVNEVLLTRKSLQQESPNPDPPVR